MGHEFKSKKQLYFLMGIFITRVHSSYFSSALTSCATFASAGFVHLTGLRGPGRLFLFARKWQDTTMKISWQ